MEAAGLAIAVFNEVFDICVFITQTVADAANHDEDFGKLEIEFTYQHAILDTFGKRFIHGRIIYKLEDVWVVQLNQILQQLKKVVIAYRGLSAKYNDNYKKTKADTPWWKPGKADREDLRREVASAGQPTTPSKNRRGFRNHFSRKRTQLEWALFDRPKLEDIVKDHRSWTEKLVEIMKLTLLLHSSNDILQVEDLSKDAQILGFSSLTNKRLLILDQTRGGQAKIIDPKSITFTKPTDASLTIAMVNDTESLIEYKLYLKDSAQMDFSKTEERIQFLSCLLSVVGEGEGENAVHSSSTSLHCLGYFHEPEKSRFGVAFRVPQGRDRAPITLNFGITTLRRDARPTLGQCFGMAYTIGYALMEWFLVDWVHKSINSHNIYLFRETGASGEGWDFSSAYLGGFEYARPAQDSSNEAYNHADFHTNIYRHPARQGLPSAGFKKAHDIYSFGVLLLEIGLWTIATSTELFKDKTQKPDAIRETLVKNARMRLGHYMGQKYRDAVLFCLEGAFNVEGDDEKQTKLTTAFNEKVLDVCKEGRKLL